MIPYDPNSAILQFDGNRMDLVIEYRNNIRGPYSLALQQILDKMRQLMLLLFFCFFQGGEGRIYKH